MNLYNQVAQSYYKSLSSNTNTVIIKLSNRKVSFTGHVQSTSGETKEALMNHIKSFDRTSVALLYNPLSQALIERIQAVQCDETYSNLSEPVAHINNIAATKMLIRELQEVTVMSIACVDSLLELFRQRDERIIRVLGYQHRDINYKSSIFIGSDATEKTMNYDRDTFEPQIFGGIQSFENLHRIYMSFLKEDTWILIIVDIASQKFHYVNGTSIYVMDEDIAYMNHVRGALNRLLAVYYPNRLWSCTPYPYRYNVDGIILKEESGMYIISFLYFVVLECPVIFTKTDISEFRKHFSVWVLEGKMPI
jgi:hypothetical protein